VHIINRQPFHNSSLQLLAKYAMAKTAPESDSIASDSLGFNDGELLSVYAMINFLFHC
jgi:hypothetical protein